MAAIILGWNPLRWNGWDPSYDEVAKRVEAVERVQARWSVANRVNIDVGTDAWLLLQGRERGLIGRAVVTTTPFLDVHYGDPAKTLNYVEVLWRSLLPLSDRITPDILEAEAPGVGWNHVYGSGKPVPGRAESAVHDMWRRHGGR
jgi:hypothetical protein